MCLWVLVCVCVCFSCILFELATILWLVTSMERLSALPCRAFLLIKTHVTIRIVLQKRRSRMDFNLHSISYASAWPALLFLSFFAPLHLSFSVLATLSLSLFTFSLFLCNMLTHFNCSLVRLLTYYYSRTSKQLSTSNAHAKFSHFSTR